MKKKNTDDLWEGIMGLTTDGKLLVLAEMFGLLQNRLKKSDIEWLLMKVEQHKEGGL